MPTRTSIELHTGVRLVEVDVPARRSSATADARVRAFVTSVPGAADADALAPALRALREQHKLPKQAWVTIWGLRAVQQFLRLPPAKPADLETLAAREARREISAIETPGDRASVGVVVGAETQVGAQKKREVSLVAVSSAEVHRRIQPVVDAGFIVEGVLTPALGLTAIARTRVDVLAGTAAAYVALNAQATCLAIIRDGTLLFAREMPWGHARAQEQETGDHDVAERLVSELRRSVLYFKQTFRANVEAVVLCGDMPNLRVLTAPLGEGLAVPVQTLDSLVGIDAVSLPQPAEQFRANVASLRLAIGAGADPAPPANLLPATIRTSRVARQQMIRLGASLAASVMLIAVAYVLAQRSGTAYASEKIQIEAEIARLEPQAQQRTELRQQAATATARRAALGAFESQGPRLARILEVLAVATTEEIVLGSITVEADGVYWLTRVSGVAVTGDAGSGQAAVNALIRAASASPYIGMPGAPPSRRVVTGRGGRAAAAPTEAGESVAPVVPEGMSGVEFALQFRVAK